MHHTGIALGDDEPAEPEAEHREARRERSSRPRGPSGIGWLVVVSCASESPTTSRARSTAMPSIPTSRPPGSGSTSGRRAPRARAARPPRSRREHDDARRRRRASGAPPRWRGGSPTAIRGPAASAARSTQLADVAELGDRRAARPPSERRPGRLELGGARHEVGAHLLLQVQHLGSHLDAGERLVEQSVDGGHGQCLSGVVLASVWSASRSSRESMMSRVATQAATLPR